MMVFFLIQKQLYGLLQFFLVQASSSVLDLIATLSAGIFFFFVLFLKKKKSHSDLSKSTSKHLYLFIVSEKFLQIKGERWGGKERTQGNNKKKLRPNQFASSFCAAHVMTELLTLKFFSGAILQEKKQINKQTKNIPLVQRPV